MKRSTLTDISKQTVYFISTISRALNGKSKDYRIIGLLVPHIENPFFAEIAKTMIHEAQKSGYITSVRDKRSEKQSIKKLVITRIFCIFIFDNQ